MTTARSKKPRIPKVFKVMGHTITVRKLPPELCEVIDGTPWFRGEKVKI